MRGFRLASLLPPGFTVEGVDMGDATTVITVRAAIAAGMCPMCGRPSSRIHSRYHRRLADLPVGGRMVQLLVLARRFYCPDVLCDRRIFTERFKELGPWARRTARLDAIVHHLGLALGGRRRVLPGGS